MNTWYKMLLEKLPFRSFAIFRWLMTFLLALSLTSCGEKAVSQDVSVSYGEKPQQISQQFSEVAPPKIIQELRSSLEAYQPQVTIVTPKPDELLTDNTVTARFQVKDLPIFKNTQWGLGPHLHVILDNQPHIPIYDLNQPLVLPDLSPGTHTLRVFASRPWDESFKNEGAYAQTTFHVFTKTADNEPDTSLPLLTYSDPQGSYGTEPILLDFYLTNAPLHIAGKDNPNDQISDWRIRCTINGESFVFDRWQAVYLKGFKTGKNWVKLEFLDNQGNPVKNAFNTTVRLIDYQPKTKDTLARIFRGELKAEEVRGIVEPNYTAKQPDVKSIPQIQPSPETPDIRTEVTPTPQATELPVKPTPETQKPKFTQPSPTLPEIIESPALEPQPEVTKTPEPEITPTPQEEVNQGTKVRLGDYFKRRPTQTIPEELNQETSSTQRGAE